MHFGTGPDHLGAFVDLDPYILDEHLVEIEVCSRVSKSVFFLVSHNFSYSSHLIKWNSTQSVCIG